MYTLADSVKDYRPAIALTRLLSRTWMNRLRFMGFWLAVIAASTGFALTYTEHASYSTMLYGVSLIAAAVWLDQLLAYSYHNSYYFRGLNSVIGLDTEPVGGATYDVAELVHQSEDDVTKAFCTHRLGAEVLLRTGLTTEAIETMLRSARPHITTSSIPLPPTEIFTIIGLGKYLIQQDPSFAKLFTDNGITHETFLGTLRWIVGTHHHQKRRLRWWSKDNLSRTKGIGSELSYGVAYLLERFSRDIRTSAVFSTLTSNAPLAEAKITEIETALARAKAANVMIIGEAGVGKMDLLMAVQKRMDTGKSLAAITGQHMIVLDTNRLFTVHRDKQSFELTILQMFSEAARAGNTIIVIENISTVLREAEALGVFLPELLDEFLSLPDLHVVVTDTPGNYHSYLERLGGFARRFAEVLIDTPDLSATTRVLEQVALTQEHRYQVVFTYPALTAITNSADRYIVEGVMPDKAVELLIDIATRAKTAGTTLITEDVVYQLVSDKTGIPAGPIQDSERDTLLNLADRLHERVIGQQPALDAIARTMRRARAGIQATDKPIGSFLFLGPTGVGKTETAKALAHLFFGSEQHMVRLDMSEYSGPDALVRLIGDDLHSGALADALREHPYCVLLVDEFEKATRQVHDLFLQILDEGVFTDARGATVNARNTIIIATSNAGSDLIIRTVQQRHALQHLAQDIIDHIVKAGIYRPELINRFDSTIIFEPLTQEEQGQVANLMLKGLYTRIEERGYHLTVTPDLARLLVERGYNPTYGARPMQRLIQDVIEEAVAQKIISGGVSKGGIITLSRNDINHSVLPTLPS